MLTEVDRGESAAEYDIGGQGLCLHRPDADLSQRHGGLTPWCVRGG